MDYTVCCETGLVRNKNEDNYLADQLEDYSLFFVADGMGGHKAGEVASKLALETIRHFPFKMGRPLVSQIKEAIMTAHREICQNQSLAEEYQGMGTTVSGGLISDNIYHWGHVGDSRIYYFRTGELQQLTTDHSLVQKLVNEDKITPEEAENHPQKHMLLQALGGSPTIEADAGQLELMPGDLLFLCTDGVSNMVQDQFLAALFKEELSLQEKSDKLKQEIIDNGAIDNYTFILIDVQGL